MHIGGGWVRRVSWRASFFKKKHAFDQNRLEKVKKNVSMSNNAISNPMARRKIDIVCLRKVLETTHLTHFWNDGFR